MDTLSHALWGKGLFGYRGNSKVAIFFGAMPDLFSFGLLFIIKLITGNRGEFGAPKLETIPDWLFLSYDIFHSFITAFLCIAIVFYYKKILLLLCSHGHFISFQISPFIQKNISQQNFCSPSLIFRLMVFLGLIQVSGFQILLVLLSYLYTEKKWVLVRKQFPKY